MQHGVRRLVVDDFTAEQQVSAAPCHPLFSCMLTRPLRAMQSEAPGSEAGFIGSSGPALIAISLPLRGRPLGGLGGLGDLGGLASCSHAIKGASRTSPT